MTPRRKPSPAPIERRSVPMRVLAPVLALTTGGSRLPTAAALALALASAGCLLAEDESVRPDPASRSVQTVKAMSSAKRAKTASGDAGPMIDPDPMPLPGEAAMVLPVPVPSAAPAPVSSTHPRVAGRMPAIRPKPAPTGVE